MQFLTLAAATALAVANSVSAVEQGFNYGATNSDGSCRGYNNFIEMFDRASNLSQPGFTSARLYTNIQCGTENTPTEAIQAAIDTQTNLLLGIWASGGQDMVNQEIAALQQAIVNSGSQLQTQVIGISVGSEDLYRSSAEGQANGAGVGATSEELLGYVQQVRQALEGTLLADVPIGHVDTATPWAAPENAVLIENLDWIGHNSFPYFVAGADISQAKTMFDGDVANIESIANGKPVWVTETGWPTRGPATGAVASVENAQRYWDEVGCPAFGQRNIWYYTLYDANTAQTDISFAVVNPDAALGEMFPLACSA